MTAAERLVANGYEDAIVLDGYDDALVGVTEDGRAVYDFDKMVKCLMDAYEWPEGEAVDWIDYNTIRALPYMGEMAPVIMHTLLDE